ncbi:MAG: T9SS type A sorting domain-containing protein [Hymenobacteraceae bacterium]|nr:T9SS type A sorting domain-containing protein [Hymenobacteraceae bacterium]
MNQRLRLLVIMAVAVTGSFSAAAQTVFAPLGAEWWYEWRGLLIPPPSYTHVRVVGDSVVGGYLARKILVEEVADPDSGYQVVYTRQWFVRVDRGEVFRWNATAGTYELELNFERPIGAGWNLPGCTSRSGMTLVLDSVQRVAVGGMSLRQQFYSIQGQAGSGYFPVLERVGVEGNILFYTPSCGPGPAEAGPVLLSYADSTLRTGTPPPLGRSESPATAAFSVVPNPSASGRFRLEGLTTTTKPVRYVVFDGQGRRIRAGQLTVAAPELNLATEPAGIYLLRGEVGGKAFTRRLIR